MNVAGFGHAGLESTITNAKDVNGVNDLMRALFSPTKAVKQIYILPEELLQLDAGDLSKWLDITGSSILPTALAAVPRHLLKLARWCKYG